MFKKLLQKAKLRLGVVIVSYTQRKCTHYFKVEDFVFRDESGFVTWPCSKCKKVFREAYGLKVLENGECDGKWGQLKN